MVSVEEDDYLSGLEDVSSDGEDDTYEAESTDDETDSAGSATVRRPNRKRARETSEELPLMEGVGKSFRVLGFNQSQRATFLKTLMRFGAGEYDWVKFTSGLKQKTWDEIHNYGKLFLSHLMENVTDSPTFSDGVPKEGLIVEDVLTRIGLMGVFRDKVKALSDCSTLFTDDIISRYPELEGGRFWKEHHDRLLLQAVMKHGYGRWKVMVYDKDLQIEQVICQELNLSLTDVSLRRKLVEFVKIRVLFLQKGLEAELKKANGRTFAAVNDESGDKNSEPEGSNAQTSNQPSLIDLIADDEIIPFPSNNDFPSNNYGGRLKIRRRGSINHTVDGDASQNYSDPKKSEPEGSNAQTSNQPSLIDLIADDEIIPFPSNNFGGRLKIRRRGSINHTVDGDARPNDS